MKFFIFSFSAIVQAVPGDTISTMSFFFTNFEFIFVLEFGLQLAS